MDLQTILPNSKIIDDQDNSTNQKLVRLDPADCEHVLKHRNLKNRPIRRHTVARFVDDMKNGRFKGATHQGIAFDANGHLIDGQHRFAAIVQLKQSHVLRVWTNRDPNDFAVIDTGVARIASDNLHHCGVPRARLVAPGIKHCLLYKKYQSRTWSNMEMPSSGEIGDFYYKNQFIIDKIADIVHDASTSYRTLNRPGLFVLCFLAVEAGYKIEEVIVFCHNLAKGAGLAEENPILAYRNFLSNFATRNIAKGSLQQFSVACLIKVWNYTHEGVTIKQFKVPQYPPMPAICLPIVQNNTKLSKNLRYSILQRDNFTCQACGARNVDGAILEVDHKVPRSKGGSNDPSNLETLCSNCNGGKSDKTEEDFIAVRSIALADFFKTNPVGP
jgi:hypothetical protein